MQLSAWAEVKARNGWRAERHVVDGASGPLGLQLLTLARRGIPWAIGYAPRGPIGAVEDREAIASLTAELRAAGRARRLVEIGVDPEVEVGHPLVAALLAAGWRPAPSLQPDRSRLLDLTPSEDELWAGVRSKWRQYVNKARRGGVTVEDAGESGLEAFYDIYLETGRRAGFVVRAPQAYADVYRAFARGGRARLLLARLADGTPVATQILLACGRRVIEPYGGMTEAGAESRANYLLKWEAIRTSREHGFRTYDMWGLAHPGIEQFKAGFGGREAAYAGTFTLVLNPAVREAVGIARRAQVAVARRRQGLPVRGGPPGGESGASGGGDPATGGSGDGTVHVARRDAHRPDGWDEQTVDVRAERPRHGVGRPPGRWRAGRRGSSC
jgi:lipid II:glycine glycyltransferase (peptidoglycan interpeptide bridge formation enzyme)